MRLFAGNNDETIANRSDGQQCPRDCPFAVCFFTSLVVGVSSLYSPTCGRAGPGGQPHHGNMAALRTVLPSAATGSKLPYWQAMAWRLPLPTMHTRCTTSKNHMTHKTGIARRNYSKLTMKSPRKNFGLWLEVPLGPLQRTFLGKHIFLENRKNVKGRLFSF